MQQINRRGFKTACRKAKLSDKLSLYCLRHSFASLSLADGATIHEVADAMGHANTKLVLSTYGHALPEKRAEVFTKLGARIFG